MKLALDQLPQNDSCLTNNIKNRILENSFSFLFGAVAYGQCNDVRQFVVEYDHDND